MKADISAHKYAVLVQNPSTNKPEEVLDEEGYETI